MVRSCGVDAAAAAGDGGVGVTVAGGAVAVAAGVGAAVRFWIAEGFAEAVGLGELPAVWGSSVGVLRGEEGKALALPSVMSRPALSMANQAVADTPPTAASQIAAPAPTERRFITMSPLCHLRDKKLEEQATPNGVCLLYTSDAADE